MKIAGLIWLDSILEKLEWKHGVQPWEVNQVFANRPQFRYVEKGHRPGENVYAAGGRTDAGRPLVVFFVYKDDSRWEFVRYASRLGIPFFEMSEEEWNDEQLQADRL